MQPSLTVNAAATTGSSAAGSKKVAAWMHRGQLQLQLHKVKAKFGRSFTAQPAAVCQPVRVAGTPTDAAPAVAPAAAPAAATAAEIAHETDLAIDAYLHESAGGGTGAPQLAIESEETNQDAFDREMQREVGGLEPVYNPLYGEGWEEECEHGDTPIERRTKGVEAPCVMARGTIDRSRYNCWERWRGRRNQRAQVLQ